MPAINSAGNVIQERLLTKEEQYLKKLDYALDEKEIWNLTPRQFRMWLYGLDPTVAMLFGCRHSFKVLCDIKRHKWKFLWRMIWAS